MVDQTGEVAAVPFYMEEKSSGVGPQLLIVFFANVVLDALPRERPEHDAF
jgi:hypothetical protein